MKYFLPILIGLLSSFSISLSQYLNQNACTGIKAPDGSTYDISSLNGVYQISQETDNTYVYNISICGRSTNLCAGNGACAGIGDAGVCQTWAPSFTTCCGSYPGGVTGLNGGAGVVIHYSNGDKCGGCAPPEARETYVYLLCGNGATPTGGTISGGEKGATPVFNATFHTSVGCVGGVGRGPSGGWIFIIIFFCVLFVYVVGGIIFNIAVRKMSGKEVFPNSSFWCEVPALIRDGGICIRNKVSGKSGYTTVGN